MRLPTRYHYAEFLPAIWARQEGQHATVLKGGSTFADLLTLRTIVDAVFTATMAMIQPPSPAKEAS